MCGALRASPSTSKTVHENESIYIPMDAAHRLENPGKIMLELIETGGYLGEGDIIRIEDDYAAREAEFAGRYLGIPYAGGKADDTESKRQRKCFEPPSRFRSLIRLAPFGNPQHTFPDVAVMLRLVSKEAACPIDCRNPRFAMDFSTA